MDQKQQRTCQYFRTLWSKKYISRHYKFQWDKIDFVNGTSVIRKRTRNYNDERFQHQLQSHGPIVVENRLFGMVRREVAKKCSQGNSLKQLTKYNQKEGFPYKYSPYVRNYNKKQNWKQIDLFLKDYKRKQQ